MIIQLARRKHQRGSSLVELMISAMLGVILIGIVGSLFLSLQKSAKDKSLHLNLMQSLDITLSVIKEDIQRAGYDGGLGSSLKLSGAAGTVSVSGASSIGFVYFKDGSFENKDYRNIKYRRDGDRLLVCEEGVLTSSQIKGLSDIGSCKTLLDDGILKVNQFSVSSAVVANTQASSKVTTIILGLSTLDGSLSETSTTVVKQSNWQ
ncbi:pilus assembly protein PilW [Vibrio vulnificus]|uniref:PilW family protein n=1 Tax=Vibrio vulnificus TaxID=672 RepID=UPI00102CF496|nr:prepilin-type N-terminal cleavage/methylation domain-containing protein [Vibrio vulnificus]RZR11219.1 pilus assembly protein PilW [Vibrio vulnificus]